MSKRKLSKFDEKYIKSNYITEYRIDDDNKKIHVYYIDGTSYDYPLSSISLSNIKRIMQDQYYEWGDLVKRVYLLNPIMMLYINNRLKKQKYYLEHEGEFNRCNIKQISLDKKITKKEICLMNESKKDTHSYFNLSSACSYKLSTMKKVHNILSFDKKSSSSSKKR